MRRLNWDWLLCLMSAALLFAGMFAVVKVARAGVSCSVPFNLTNGTLADASQVMANYNAILACLANNTAESGANSSITSLSGLTTPISPAQGGTPVFIGTASGGSNAITVGFTQPNNFSLTTGNKVIFPAGSSNTAATTLTVVATATKNLYRITTQGVVPMVGGEIKAGQMVEVVYDGTQYQMTSLSALDIPPGTLFDSAGFGPSGACPTGSLPADGSNVATALYPTLSSILGTTWGSPGGGNFTLPDLRGRTTFSTDSGGSGRITAAGGNFDGTVVGNTGGQQNKVVNQVNLASFGLTVTDPGHAHSLTTATPTYNGQQVAGAGVAAGSSSGVTSTGTSTTGITVASGGSSTPLPTLSNAAIVLKCIKG